MPVTRRKLSILTLSFAFSLIVSFAVLAATVTGAGHIAVNSGTVYTWASGTSGTFDWTTSNNWSPPGVPGTTANDTVSFSGSQSMTIQVTSTDVIPNPVTINNNASTGVTIEVAGGTLPIASSVIATTTSGSGNVLKVSSGTLNMTGATLALNGSGPTGGKLQFSGGTITGGAISVAGPAATGGSIVCDGTAGTMSFAGVTINNSGLINYSSSSNTLSLDSGTVLTNNGELDLNNNVIATNNAGAPRVDNPSGGVVKSIGTGAAGIATTFNNSGVVQFASTSGTLGFSGGGTHIGTFQHNSSTNYTFNGAHVFNSGASISACSGCSTSIQGGTFTDNVGLSINNLTQNGGTLNGTGATTLNGFTWNGGTQSGGGTTTLLSPSNGAFNGTAIMTLDQGRVFTVQSGAAVTYAPAAGYLEIDNGSSITNSGTFKATNDAKIANAVGAAGFNNPGTLIKNGGTGTTVIQPDINATGPVTVMTGSISFPASLPQGGKLAGNVTTLSSSNAVILPGPGPTTFTGATNVNGPGTLLVNGGTLTAGVPLTLNSLLELKSGTTDASLTLNSGMKWEGGVEFGLVIPPGRTLDATSPLAQLQIAGTIDNNGTFNFNPAFDLFFGGGNAFINNNNGAVFSVGSGNGNILAPLPFIDAIMNAGTIRKNGSGTLQIQALINNTGTIDVQQGTLQFNRQSFNGSSNSGVINISPGTIFEAAGGTIGLNAGTSFTGTGTFKVSGGTINVNAMLSVGTPVSLLSGTINLNSPLTLTGAFSFSGGTISGPSSISSGNTTINPGGANAILSGAIFNNTGTTTISGSSGTVGLQLVNGAAFNNPAGSIVDLSGDRSIFGGATETFTNAGTFKKSAAPASGVSTIQPVFNNSGSVNLLAGQLWFTGNGNDTGSYSGASFTALVFAGGTRMLNASASLGPFSSNAFVDFEGGTVTDAGAFDVAGLTTIDGGSLILNTASPPKINGLHLHSGLLGGSSGFSVNQGFGWFGGTLGGGPAITIPVGSTLSIAPDVSSPILDGRIININGQAFYGQPTTSLPLYVNNGGGFMTSAGSGFLVQSNEPILTTAGSSSFVNLGSFEKALSSGITVIDSSFNNEGDVYAATGTIDFRGGFTQSGPSSSTYLANANIQSSFGALNFNGGFIAGSGSINGSVVNAALLDPGNRSISNPSPGTITITGNYTQTATGTLHIDLGGATTGQFDQLDVTGTASLAGNLTVANAGAFSAAAGNTFSVLQFGSLTGDFTHPYTLPPVTGGTMQAAYAPVGTPTSLVLTAVGNADLGVTISGPAMVTAAQNATYTVNAGNSGPASAANPGLTVMVSAGSLVSATGGGWTCTLSNSTTSCAQPALANGAMAPLTLVVVAPPSGTIGVNAAITSTAPDPSTANNNASFMTTVTPAADLSINKTGPSSTSTGSQVTYSIIVTNNGPSPAQGVLVTDPTPTGATFISVAGGGCTAFPCSLGTMAAGQTISLSAKYQLTNTTGNLSNTASVSSATTDPIAINNSSTISTIVGCPIAPGNLLPAQGVSNVPTSGMLSWNNTGAESYNVYLGPMGGGCSTLIGNTSVPRLPYSSLQPGTAYEWRVEAVTPNCPTNTSSCVSFTTSSSCATSPATLIAPASGAAVSNPVTFTWSAVSGATSYDVLASVGGGMATNIGTTSGTSLTASVPSGTVTWYVVANGVSGCGPLQSPPSSFSACSLAIAPIPGVIGEATTNQMYKVQWDSVPGALTYQIDEANNEAFSGASTQTVTATSTPFTHSVLTAHPFFYRVRAVTDCNQQPGPYSTTIRVVIIPLPQPNQINPSTTVPAGSTNPIVEQVFIPGIGGGSFTFIATTDRPWLTVSPPTGVLPIDGITLDVTADPANLPNGTFTATVIVSITQVGAAKVGSNAAAAVVSVPVSINLVTPVTSGPGSSPQSNSLIIPSVGHLDGINSHWQSDIRLNNPTTDHQRYQLIFTPSGTDASTGVKTTTIDVNSGETTALDDIVRNWYGVGSLGDSANGFLEIRPIAPTGKGLEANAVDVTKAVASSRTYNVSNNGTLGQFIPAIPFASFIAKAAGTGAVAPILSLQQIAQSDAFRTNIGLVEASGQPASVLLSVFNSAGIKIQDFPINLKGSEQKQLNSFLALNNITLPDGRIQVQVTSGGGKVTAYASVIDNNSGVPLLVSGVPLGATQNNHYVLPGVADLNTGGASWRTDMRIFNGGTTPQAASLVFYPQNVGGSSPSTQSVTINPGEVKTLDNILQSTFGQTNVGGAMHILTMSNSSLIVTGRTYNLTPNGTFGQFIPAVTPFDAVGKGDRSLQILQVEDSVRYRTNLGLAEVTGNAVSVEVTVVTPDSKVTPKLTFTMQPNEFRQFGIIRDLGLGNTYNARISVRVLDGTGRVTAYGSVIDMITQDPTYVPAQ
jgi:uncharacterized repeat protein (TIGR01451 family)